MLTHQNKTNSHKGVRIVVTVIVLLFIFIVATGASKDNSPQPATAAKPATSTSQTPQMDTQSPAYKLADYDLNHAPDAATVAQYQTALDGLRPLCTEPEDKIAAEIWASWQDLEKNGVTDETNLTLIGHIKDSVPDGTVVNCQGVMAAYLTLREPSN